MASLDEGCERERDPGKAESLRRGNPNPCPIVAIGASAGGLETFQELFRRMPSDLGAAFILIQHLSPGHETLIPELLAPYTGMPIQRIADETVIASNHVYVMPPGMILTIDDCVLYLTRPPRNRGRVSPIDRFFRSLAEDQEDEAVAVVLSGTGADGALGLRAVKERGGLTLAQAPETANQDGMPRSAILTGMVDHVLPVEEIPAKIREHLARTRDGRNGSPLVLEEVVGHLGKICALLRRATGHDFRSYKRSTLVRRVRRRMIESRSASVEAYVGLLARDAEEVEALFRDLLIGVTYFFRDPEAFEALAAKIVPRLFEGKDADGSVRVWVPGCATGEEAYSIAILLRERMETLEAPPQVQVFATDIDVQAVEAARQGWYPESVAAQIAPERLERWFVRHGNMLQASRDLREMCLFSTHNLIADPPFSRLDLISCRNLLIYLESDLQAKIHSLFHYALRPGGFLFLGPAETVTGKPELFRKFDKTHRIFQARDAVSRPSISFPLVERGRFVYRVPEEALRRNAVRRQEVARVFESVLLESYAPACVVVNENGGAVYFSPRTGRYLEPPAGAPTDNIVDMARKGLRLDLRTALHKAVGARATVLRENVSFELDGQTQRLNLVVRPLPELGEDPGLFMVVFQEIYAESEPDRAPLSLEDPAFRKLEAELRATKDHLQATLEELETSNEELVSSNEELLSMNEELQSANEELQTSKEELQSVNQELETVNAELRKKVEELDRVTGDLRRSEGRLRRLVDSDVLGVLTSDGLGNVSEANDAYLDLLGYTREDLAAGRLDWRALTPPEYGPLDDAGVAEARARGACTPYEKEYVRKDGSRVPVLIGYALLDEEAEAEEGRYICFVLDLTARKRLEEELRRRTEQLLEADQRKDEFLAMLGHELRNPLAPIRNCLNVLKAPAVTKEQAENAVRTMDRQVVHLKRIVDDLLDVARVSRGKILLRRQRTDLVELVRAAVEDQRPGLESAGLRLSVDLPGSPLRVLGDPTRLSQAVGNVLHNAGKFTDPGGRIEVGMRQEPDRGMVSVTVRDTGAGMEPDVLARIFEPFIQGESGPDRGRGGLGLGLALVRGLVLLHGGAVEAASPGLGRGSEVTLRLPLASGDEETTMSDEPVEQGPEPSRRCLVIEDHVDAAESLALLLRLIGHEVEVAFDATQGLETARRFRPEVILCDIGLPGALDGYGAARAFRADPELRSAYLIALTGYGQEEDRRKALEAGFDTHLTKPADLDALRRLLAAAG